MVLKPLLLYTYGNGMEETAIVGSHNDFTLLKETDRADYNDDTLLMLIKELIINIQHSYSNALSHNLTTKRKHM